MAYSLFKETKHQRWMLFLTTFPIGIGIGLVVCLIDEICGTKIIRSDTPHVWTYEDLLVGPLMIGSIGLMGYFTSHVVDLFDVARKWIFPIAFIITGILILLTDLVIVTLRVSLWWTPVVSIVIFAMIGFVCEIWPEIETTEGEKNE